MYGGSATTVNGGAFDAIGGNGGSGGLPGANGYYIGGSTVFGGNGGNFGGGGGGTSLQWTDHNPGDGGVGAVRIIWGLNRSYPSTNTANV